MIGYRRKIDVSVRVWLEVSASLEPRHEMGSIDDRSPEKNAPIGAPQDLLALSQKAGGNTTPRLGGHGRRMCYITQETIAKGR